MFRIPPPYLWTPLSPQRVKGCSPLTIPKMRSKPKNASRFAKRIFLCFSHLRLRRRFHVSAGRYRQQRGNTSCEAANRRNEKKAFSEAASFFPFRQLLWGLKGASSPFLVDPARRNRWCFSGSLLARKRELSPNAKALYPRATGAKPHLKKKSARRQQQSDRPRARKIKNKNPRTGGPGTGVLFVNQTAIKRSC